MRAAGRQAASDRPAPESAPVLHGELVRRASHRCRSHGRPRVPGAERGRAQFAAYGGFLRVALLHAACCIGCSCALRRRMRRVALVVVARCAAAVMRRLTVAGTCTRHATLRSTRIGTDSGRCRCPAAPQQAELVPRVPPYGPTAQSEYREYPHSWQTTASCESAGAGGRRSTPGWCPNRSKPLERSHPR